MSDHIERVTILDSLSWDCVEGECEHSEEADMDNFENCPTSAFEVCVDCMDELGHGRDPRFWEQLVSHVDPVEPEPEPEPAIFKPNPDRERDADVENTKEGRVERNE